MNLRITLRSSLLVGLLLLTFGVDQARAASAGEWKRLRESARTAVKANEFELALDQYQLAFKEAAEAFKGTDMRFLETVSEAAGIHAQFRRFDQAIEMYQAALERMPKARGGEQTYKAAFLTELAKIYKYSSKADLAEASFHDAIKFAEEKLGEQSPQLASALEGLASIYIDSSRPGDALPLLKRALHIAANAGRGFSYFDGVQLRSTRGNPTTGEYSIQNTIGILHLSQSNYADADKAFRDALNTVNRQRAEGAQNFVRANTASLERNLAQAYRGQKEFRKAEDALIRSIVLGEKLE
ncbi:MAG TPA: tetratricopeptide repeat protein, partial [Candidatus Kapabacteria bacterium]|nr:tetratricopeptide repeat protein [Candidatus Kapabacteria bacterium]